MAFAVVVNHTTNGGVKGSIQINEDTPIAYGPLSANIGTSPAQNIQSGSNLTIKVAVEGAPHSGTSRANSFKIGQYGVAVLEITQNGYVNFYTEEQATTNSPIKG